VKHDNKHLVGTGLTANPCRHLPRPCRCGAQMEPSLDLHRKWTFTDDSQPPRQRVEDYTALSWTCPSCGRRLDVSMCWSEPPDAPLFTDVVTGPPLELQLAVTILGEW